METVKIYQIGVGSFGRFGFEKFIEMEKHLPEAEAEVVGVCDQDPERVERAKKFAEVHGSSIETFTEKDEMYKHADDQEGQVLVYDATSSDQHSDNVYESLRRGFYHISEKPSSMTREAHLEEKKLSQDRDVKFLVDFIERENPVVKKALEILEGEEIDTIKIFRENSVGVQKILHPVNRSGVRGGDVLDKMIHEIYSLDFLEQVNESFNLELEEADVKYFMPKDFDSEKLMSVDGGYTRDINEETATAMTEAVLESGDASVELHSSWIGLSDSSRSAAEKFREELGEEFFDQEFVHGDDGEKAYVYEDARFFVIRGSRNLAGDMLNERLYDLETGEEVETRDLLHDQLYRVLEDAVLEAAGLQEAEISEKEINVFMNRIFDIREEGMEGKDFFEELEKANEKLESLAVQDGKILENEESETIAG
jgi:predicted dehydrogenase